MSSRISSHLSFDQALDDISRAYLQDVDIILGDEQATRFVGALSDWWEGRLDVFSLTVTTFLVFAEKSAFTLPHGLNGILSLKGPLPRVHYSWNNNDQDDFIAIISPSGSRIYLLSRLYSSPSSPWMFSTEGLKDDELAELPSRLDQQTARWAIQLLHIELNLRQLEVDMRKRYMKVLHRLVQKFQVLPPSLFLRDVVQEDQYPVSGGGYADIFKGHLKLTKFSHETKPVCMKALRVFQNPSTTVHEKLLKGFCREAFLWTHLKHENILPCFGVSMEVIPGRFSLISPWMSKGNIMEFLQVDPGHNRLDAIVGVARGLSYLHSLEPQLVHGDIKGANILVTDDGRCCLADFGLCLMVETHTVGGTATTFSVKGTTRWLAPEVLEPTEEKYLNPNKAARDIYAFACTVLQIYTGKPPFADRQSDSSVIYAIMQGKRPSRPEEMQMPWLDSVWQLMEECWLDDSHSRPHASDIVHWLERVSMEHDPSVPSPHSRTRIMEDLVPPRPTRPVRNRRSRTPISPYDGSARRSLSPPYHANPGCYTCRIRRKKCDERPNDMNACETCVRLRLECLGWGAKRPYWLRDRSTVLALREKIKTFLASGGVFESESVILRLNEHNYCSSPSESPQSDIFPLSSLALAEDFRPPHTTSALREEHWGSGYPSPYHPADLVYPRHDPLSFGPAKYSPTSPQLRQHSPVPYLGFNNKDLPYTFEPYNASSNHLAPWLANPTVASSFSPLYYATLDDGLDYMDDVLPPRPFPTWLPSDDLLEHHTKTVVGFQYPLTDRSKLNDIVASPLSANGFLSDSTRLLAQIHSIRSRAPLQSAFQSEGVKERYEALQELLRQPTFNLNDAMASLNVVSAFILDGGTGEWEQWLNVACSYCENTIKLYPDGVVEALMAVDERQRFLIKRTIWFDVLASVTTLKSPRLLIFIRALCSPHSSGVYDPSVPTPPELSMMSLMGCENTVVWALAETSALAAWKRSQEGEGNLSMPELITKGSDISRYITPLALSQSGPVLEQFDVLCRSTAEIFRTSARIYLASVVSGDYVSVPEIADAVNDLVRCVQRMPSDNESVDAIVRSTVFAFLICGCFTDDRSYRDLISEHLSSRRGAGNCASAKDMLEEIWNTRSKKKSDEPIPWRKMLYSKKLLLAAA